MSDLPTERPKEFNLNPFDTAPMLLYGLEHGREEAQLSLFVL
jgi:hypothetical protein